MFGTYRYILAQFVVIGHFLGMRHAGGAAVFSFYILSGFLMTLLMKEKYGFGVKSFFSFVYHRCLRIYPMYWIAVLISFVAIAFLGNEFSKSVNGGMFMPEGIYAWFRNIFIATPMNQPLAIKPRFVTPSWALTVEIFYYLLIALGISSSRKRCLWWVSLSLIYYFATYFMGYGYDWRSKSVICASLPFSLGAMLYYYKNLFPKILGRKIQTKIITLIVYSLIAIGSYIILDFTSPASASPLLDVSLIPSVLAMVFLYPEATGASGVWRKIDDALGGLSYPYYVLHWPISLWVVWFFNFDPALGLTSSGIWVFSIVMIIMTVIGLLFERFCEPSIRSLRRIYSRSTLKR